MTLNWKIVNSTIGSIIFIFTVKRGYATL